MGNTPKHFARILAAYPLRLSIPSLNPLPQLPLITQLIHNLLGYFSGAAVFGGF